MRILLDTHVLLWLLSDDPMLSDSARGMLTADSSELYFSSVSLFEIAQKHSLKPELMPFSSSQVRQDAEASNLQELEFRAIHAEVCEGLPWIHRDPFDRMLIGQAKAEGMKLMTHDDSISRYGDIALTI